MTWHYPVNWKSRKTQIKKDIYIFSWNFWCLKSDILINKCTPETGKDLPKVILQVHGKEPKDS